MYHLSVFICITVYYNNLNNAKNPYYHVKRSMQRIHKTHLSKIGQVTDRMIRC